MPVQQAADQADGGVEDGHEVGVAVDVVAGGRVVGTGGERGGESQQRADLLLLLGGGAGRGQGQVGLADQVGLDGPEADALVRLDGVRVAAESLEQQRR